MSGLQVSILASSSSGNITYIETPKQHLLVDAGLSGKKTAALMASIGRRIEDVDALLITHEHHDHVHGAGVLARRYQLPIYANEKTWTAILPKIGPIPSELQCDFPMGMTLTFGDLDVESFGVSHDAIAPQFYQFHYQQHRFVMLTDTGYVSDYVAGTIRQANGYLIECNHDLELLRHGQYAWSLKQRIMSDTGHLSNLGGAEVLADVLGPATQHIFLGHLSQENNRIALAHQTVTHYLQQRDWAIDDAIKIYDTHPDRALPLMVM